MLRLLVDLNIIMTDERGRVWISPLEVRDGMQPGMRVLLYDPGDELEAVLEVEERDGRTEWYGVPDWSTQREVYDDE